MSDDIAFIGGGNMARAIAGGLRDSGVPANRLRIAEPNETARRDLSDLFPGVLIGTDNNAIAAGAETVVFAVKPQVLPYVCRNLSVTLQAHRPLIVSIAAGVRSEDIGEWLGGGLSIIRVMPNQPALLRRGVSGLYANPQASGADRERAAGILAAVGAVVWVDAERDIDAVTAISGSGPAYFYLLIDILEQAGIGLGLTPDAARKLATQTAVGALSLVERTGEPMDALIAKVRSPGGTTAAALDYLEQRNARAIFAAAIRAARDRAEQLADEAHDDANE